MPDAGRLHVVLILCFSFLLTGQATHTSPLQRIVYRSPCVNAARLLTGRGLRRCDGDQRDWKISQQYSRACEKVEMKRGVLK